MGTAVEAHLIFSLAALKFDGPVDFPSHYPSGKRIRIITCAENK